MEKLEPLRDLSFIQRAAENKNDDLPAMSDCLSVDSCRLAVASLLTRTDVFHEFDCFLPLLMRRCNWTSYRPPPVGGSAP